MNNIVTIDGINPETEEISSQELDVAEATVSTYGSCDIDEDGNLVKTPGWEMGADEFFALPEVAERLREYASEVETVTLKTEVVSK